MKVNEVTYELAVQLRSEVGTTKGGWPALYVQYGFEGSSSEQLRSRCKNLALGSGPRKAPESSAPINAATSCEHAPPESSISMEVLFPDRKVPLTLDEWKPIFERFLDWQQAYKTTKTHQDTAKVVIPGNKPVGLVFTGDWHLTGEGTDHMLMQRDLMQWAMTDGLHLVLNGDYCDNFQPRGTPPAMADQLAPNEIQFNFFRYLLEGIKHKTLALVEGNHDNWSYKTTRWTYVKDAAEDIKRPYLRHGGLLNVQLGTQEYRIAVRHDFRFKSSLNTTNSQRQLDYFVGGADITALGHLHYAEVHHKQGKIWLRHGAYKVEDDYSDQNGFGKGQTEMPMVILWPNEKRMMPFRDYREGLVTLWVLRQDPATLTEELRALVETAHLKSIGVSA